VLAYITSYLPVLYCYLTCPHILSAELQVELSLVNEKLDTLRSESTRKIEALEKKLDEKRREIARLEKDNYDKAAAADLAAADMILLSQDLGNKNLELANLHKALLRIDVEKEQSLKQAKITNDKHIDELKMNFEEEKKTIIAIWEVLYLLN
jgi:chromosome segregation ATPase